MYPEAAGLNYREPTPHGVLVYGEQIGMNRASENNYLRSLDERVYQSGIAFEREMRLQYLVYRFIAVVEGFHKGSLDLTGRHPQRYEEHAQKWDTFLGEFMALRPVMRMPLKVVTTIPGSISLTNVDEEEIQWMAFCEKWGIPHQMMEYHDILSVVGGIFQTISQHPQPVFQKLLFSDLPNDILCAIFNRADHEAVASLSATCKRLSNIGRIFKFKTRALIYDLPADYTRKAMATKDRIGYMIQLARKKRAELINSRDVILQRPEVAEVVQDLQLTDSWGSAEYTDFSETNLANFTPRSLGANFHESIQICWRSILEGCKNLTRLSLTFITLDTRILQAICLLEKLRSLEIHACPLSPTFGRSLKTKASTTVSSQITSFLITMSDPDTEPDFWYLLPCFPNLQRLSIKAINNSLPPPPADIRGKCQFFPKLQRLSLRGCHVLDLNQVLRWLTDTPRKDCLTHFKLHSEYGFRDNMAKAILKAIRTAPLEVLVLEGLAEGELSLFEVIAKRFPKVKGLTLERRSGTRQRDSRPSIWPHQSGEYARRIASLTNLEHFGWNQKTLSMDSDTPSLASLFPIEGWSHHKEDAEEASPFEDPEPESVERWTAATFGAYCPKLQTYSTSMFVDWEIERKEERVSPVVPDIGTAVAKLGWNNALMACPDFPWS